MNQELERIIGLYQSAVAELFPRLAKHLGTELPITNNEWVQKSYEQRGTTSCGIQYFIHGYGVALKYQTTEIDFDLGAEGQINGIDPWKLWYFLEGSKIKTNFSSSKEVENAIKTEVAQGNMVYSGYMLYYLS
jgi:hypothetical protein